MSRLAKFGTPAFVIVAGLALFVRYGPTRDIPVGTAYAAWQLCSRTRVAGQEFARVRDEYVAPTVDPLPSFWKIDRRDDGVRVSADLPALSYSRRALYREGLGCSVVPPATLPGALAKQVTARASAGEASDAPWPGGEGAVETIALPETFDPILRRHQEVIFDRTRDAHTHTTALLVAHRGRLIYEQYNEGMTRENLQLGWSMTKTITALLVGLMEGDGELNSKASVGLPQWEGSKKAAITYRNLLTMTPGLDWRESHGGGSQNTEMLFGRVDGGAYAAAQPLKHAPGTTFVYSTGNASIVMLRLRQLLGGEPQPLYDYIQQRLFTPLHVRGGLIEMDASGTPVGGARGFLRPVDFLRMGQLIAQGGRWEGSQLVPEDFIQFMVTPSPIEPGYAGGLWTRDGTYVLPEHRSRLPQDFVAMVGYGGQLVLIAPSAQLLVLRMGVAHSIQPAQGRVYELFLDLLEHVPATDVEHVEQDAGTL